MKPSLHLPLDMTIVDPITHYGLTRRLNGNNTENDSSPALVIVVLIALGLFVICVLRQRRLHPAPSRETLLEQRQRQRELIRRNRLRNMNLFGAPDSTMEELGNIQRIQLTTAEAEIRRNRLVERFEANQVQTTIKEDDYVMEQPSEDIEMDDKTGTDPQKSMVRLPNRKPPQPDTVPNRCVICLDSFDVGEVIVWSDNEACQHAFHQDCIADYLVPMKDVNESPCPCCRQPFCKDLKEEMTQKDDS